MGQGDNAEGWRQSRKMKSCEQVVMSCAIGIVDARGG